jgi:hypothetical protein
MKALVYGHRHSAVMWSSSRARPVSHISLLMGCILKLLKSDRCEYRFFDRCMAYRPAISLRPCPKSICTRLTWDTPPGRLAMMQSALPQAMYVVRISYVQSTVVKRCRHLIKYLQCFGQLLCKAKP